MTDQNETGFYKFNDELFYAPNFVYAPEYTLKKEEKDTYTLPIDGWYWFNTTQEAKDFFNITE